MMRVRGGSRRRDTRTGRVRGPSAPVTYGLMLLCGLLFAGSPAAGLVRPGDGTAALLAAQQDYFDRWGVVPARLLGGPPPLHLVPSAADTLLSALFVHANWVHLLGNLLFLHVFGAMVEQRMGRMRFTFFYLVCGALALLGYALAHSGSEQSLVGASGAISAVLGAFLFLFPKARVTSLLPFLFFLPLRFPAWVVLPFWVVLQWLSVRQADQGPGVAYLAHLVGFGLGFGYAWVRWGRAGASAHGTGTRGTKVGSAPAPAPEGDSQP
ncbi:rhomboid family intramembrane serine protease [Streptomyces sp. NPDC058045]|uniref:rhomboid family intramembrane serine protease n=1 Tax=Streptomyces sp. NPDC058045 TaxID=3346311 RepID=UPI0036ED660F